MQINAAEAIVFGGASGLGAATARRLAAAGASVIVADLQRTAAERLAQELDGRAVQCDVTDPGSVADAVRVGRELRICVICAGIAPLGKLIGRDGPTPLEDFAKVINVNLLGTINVLRLVAGAMSANEPNAENERGVCVATASIAAFDGQIGQVAYAASKGGVAALTLPVARELAAIGIRLVTIAPGIFETPILAGIPPGARDRLAASVPFPARPGRPSEFGELAAHIVENVMLNGETIRLDGAVRMAPR